MSQKLDTFVVTRYSNSIPFKLDYSNSLIKVNIHELPTYNYLIISVWLILGRRNIHIIK